MLNVALTGNIAAGKSTVAELFRRWGATVIDADHLVREAQRPGSPVLAAIARRFGSQVIKQDGELDRPALRIRVMVEPALRQALNAIVHPEVQRRRAALLAEAKARGDHIVISDIPLLFEAMDPAQFDAVVLVDAPEAVRRERLMETRGLSREEADRMLAAQLPAEGKRSWQPETGGTSLHVIDNHGDRAALERRSLEVWETLRRWAAASSA